MRSISSICGLAILLAASTPVAASDEYVVAGSIAGADGGWDFASVDPETNRLFVARSNGVTAVDLATRKVTDILVEGAGVHGVSPIPGTPFAISANGKSANALLFDKLTGKIEATFPTGQGPDAIVVEPKSGLVVIFNGKSHDATLVDVTSKSVVGAIALDGKPEVGAADGTGRVFVNLEDKNAIAVIDVAARKVVGAYALNGCDAPTGLAFDQQTGVLISACDNNVAKAIDAKTGADLATLKIGKGPDGVLLDAPRLHPRGRRNAVGVGFARPRRNRAGRRREDHRRRQNRRGGSLHRERISAQRQTPTVGEGRRAPQARSRLLHDSRRRSQELTSAGRGRKGLAS